MDGIIIFFLIVIALYYLGKWYIRRKIRKFFGQFNQQAGGSTGQNQEGTHTNSKKRNSSANSPEKKKVFTADEGEYVEFEEIKD
jgi:hypothetical protein